MPAPVPTPATPTIVNPQVDGGAVPLYVECSDSGSWIVNRTFRVTLKFKVAPYSTIYAPGFYIFYRGDLVTIHSATYIVSESRIRREKGSVAVIEVDCDSIDQCPPDEYSLEPVEQNPRIERHPAFRALKSADLAIVQQAYLALSAGQIQNATNQFVNTTNQALAQKLYDKLRVGMESYYLSQWRYTWSSYYESGFEPTPALGSVTQTPGGPLFGFLGGAQWLREADHVTSTGQSPLGTIVKVTRSWIGGPATFWDPDIYPAG